MKELFIIRHAKSSWDDSTLADFDRPLNKRGMHDAPMMAQILKQRNFIPDQIVSSAANRTKRTAQFIADGLGIGESEISFTREIYESSYTNMLQLINGIDRQLERVFIVGHNPTFTYLAERLGGEYIGNLPTCGVVGLKFELDSWRLVSEGTGQQFYYDYPKNHK